MAETNSFVGDLPPAAAINDNDALPIGQAGKHLRQATIAELRDALAPDTAAIAAIAGDLDAVRTIAADLASGSGSTLVAASTAASTAVEAADAVLTAKAAIEGQQADVLAAAEAAAAAISTVEDARSAAIDARDEGVQLRDESVAARADAVAARAGAEAARDALTGPGGASLVLHKRGEAGTFARTVAQMERLGMMTDRGVSVLHWVSPEDDDALLAGVELDDGTIARFQAAADATLRVNVPAFRYLMRGSVVPNAGQTFTFATDAELRQASASTPIFRGQNRDGVTFDCNGATFRGHGAFLGNLSVPEPQRWGGNGGHDDRAFFFEGCDRLTILRPRTINFGHSGIALRGGAGIRISYPHIEGTHTHGVPIEPEANYQMLIYIQHTGADEYGAVDDLEVVGLSGTGAAHGVVVERPGGSVAPVRHMRFIDTNLWNIPGQHGFYLQGPRIRVDRATLTAMGLSGVKVQASAGQPDIFDVEATGIVGDSLGSQLFEVATVAESDARIYHTLLQGRMNGGKRGLAVTGHVERLTADVQVETCSAAAVEINGPVNDIDVTARVHDAGEDGVVVYGAGRGIKLRTVVRDCNRSNLVGGSGIRIASQDAQVEILQADVTDDGGKMYRKLFVAQSAADPAAAPPMPAPASRVVIDGPVNFADGDVRDDFGAVRGSLARPFVPTIEASGGAFGGVAINRARYRIANGIVSFDLDFTIVTVGTAAGEIKPSLPVAAIGPVALNCVEIQQTGYTMRANIPAADLAHAVVTTPTNASAIAAGRRFLLSGSYQVA